MLKSILMAGALSACLVGAAHAEVQKCAMQVGDKFQGDMIAKEIYLIFEGETLMVMDGIINFFNKGKPVEVRERDGTENSRNFEWAVFIVNKAGQRTKMTYQASFFPAMKQLNVMARPAGYPNKFSATGKCKPYNG